MHKVGVLQRWALAGLVLLLAPSVTFGAGFALFEHGARAVAMAGAFGATADDPTAAYYNPAGLAFMSGTQAASGFYLITENATFTGDNPYPGAGYSVDLKKQIFYPPHAYVTGELTNVLHYGVGVYAPFGLGTWWPNGYAGKFISKRVDLRVFNINPSLSYRVSEGLAISLGVDYFYSNLDLTKSVGAVNPYTQQVAEVGQVHLFTPFKGAFGWDVGVLARSKSTGLSFGVTYRSQVKMDYSGKASFTQFPTANPDFDAIVASQVPFGKQVAATTHVTYPDSVRVAVAWHGQKWLVEADVVRQGWNSFQDLPITLPDYPALSSVRYEGFKDSNTYRLGAEYKSSPRLAFQFGFLYDKNPVPTETVSLLLPDSDRVGYCLGISLGVGQKSQVNVGYMYLPFKVRSTQGVNLDDFNGTYKTTANLLGVTYVVRF
jgi:long-chain fatty acid transport protein